MLTDLVVSYLSVVAGIVLTTSFSLPLHMHDLVHHLHLNLLHAVQRRAIYLTRRRRKSIALSRVCTRIVIHCGAELLGTST